MQAPASAPAFLLLAPIQKKVHDGSRRLLDRAPGHVDHRPAIVGKQPPCESELGRHLFRIDICGLRRLLQRQKTVPRSEEHTSELQSLMRISYAVFCLKTTKRLSTDISNITHYLSKPQYTLQQ